MSCPNCGTQSCYICREAINGYEHFDERPDGQQRCILFDPIEARHDEEVAAARERAIEEMRRENEAMGDRILLEWDLARSGAVAARGRGRRGPLGGIRNRIMNGKFATAAKHRLQVVNPMRRWRGRRNERIQVQ